MLNQGPFCLVDTRTARMFVEVKPTSSHKCLNHASPNAIVLRLELPHLVSTSYSSWICGLDVLLKGYKQTKEGMGVVKEMMRMGESFTTRLTFLGQADYC